MEMLPPSVLQELKKDIIEATAKTIDERLAVGYARLLWLTLQVHATFEYSKYQKGCINGHERIDVVQERIEFISKLEALESSHLPPPPPSDMQLYDIGKQDAERKLGLSW